MERELGYQYDLPGDPAGHYQRVCPACRRKSLALAQGRVGVGAPDGREHDGR